MLKWTAMSLGMGCASFGLLLLLVGPVMPVVWVSWLMLGVGWLALGVGAVVWVMAVGL